MKSKENTIVALILIAICITGIFFCIKELTGGTNNRIENTKD